ncbi:hypothetical protein PFISCL1PPCAC_17092, partial [Pristionchus fissidentatus]
LCCSYKTYVVAMEPHGAEEHSEGDGIITLYHRRIDFLWSVEEFSYEKKNFLCMNEDVMVLMWWRNLRTEKSIIFYNKHTRAPIACHKVEVNYDRATFITPNLIAGFKCNKFIQETESFSSISVHFIATSDGFRTIDQKCIVIEPPSHIFRFNLACGHSGAAFILESQPWGRSSYIEFVRNEKFLRLYSQNETINWTWATHVPFSYITVLWLVLTNIR